MRLSLRALHYFLSAADRGSIARAADALNVAPSAISSAIDMVEAEFDLKLVQRYRARGIQPTASGITLMRRIRHVIEEYDNLLIEGAELRTALSGKLSIGYYAPIAPAFIPAIVKPLVGDNPDVRLGFEECDNVRAQAGLLDGAFDIILFVAENVRSGIVCRTLLEAPPYLLVPEDHGLARNRSVDFDDIAKTQLVLLDLPVTSEYYRTLLDDNRIQPPIVATASTTEMVRSLVGAGAGCSILNMWPATDQTYAGDIVKAIPIRAPSKPLKLVLGHLDGNPRRLVHAFIEACLTHFARPGAQDLIVS